MEESKIYYLLDPSTMLGMTFGFAIQKLKNIQTLRQFLKLARDKSQTNFWRGEEGKMKIYFTVLIMIFVLLVACADKPKLSKAGMDTVARDCCREATEKYYHRYYLSVSDVPVSINSVKYDVLEFDQQGGYWPVRVSCRVEVSPMRGVAGFKATVNAGTKVYQDGFGRQFSKFAYADFDFGR